MLALNLESLFCSFKNIFKGSFCDFQSSREFRFCLPFSKDDVITQEAA